MRTINTNIINTIIIHFFNYKMNCANTRDSFTFQLVSFAIKYSIIYIFSVE